MDVSQIDTYSAQALKRLFLESYHMNTITGDFWCYG